LYPRGEELDVNSDILPELLQMMHVSSGVDVMDDEVWNRGMRVRPVPVDTAKGDFNAQEGSVSGMVTVSLFVECAYDAGIQISLTS
jgi:hypothetical protein